jgi:DNA-binding LacI/PurR family transcriptional regulator
MVQLGLDKCSATWYNETGLIKPVSLAIRGSGMTAKRAVTIRDVAKKAGVSPGTVSRAINDSPLVNEQTRERILQVVQELNYSPNLAARRLSIGKTLTIAVIVPFFTRPSVSERLNGVISALSDSQYDLLIHNIETPEQRDTGFLSVLRRDRVDGALIVSLPIPDGYVEQLTGADVPIVLIDTCHPALTAFPTVMVDDVSGGRTAVEHLIQLGHERIAFVGDIVDTPFHFTSSRDRYLGYSTALNAAKIALRPEYYAQGDHGRLQAREMAKKMLSLAERPTAVFAASDTQAVGVLEGARELGVCVPGELSVIGYDDIELADIMGLTTMRQLLFESGRRGAESLLEILNDPETPPIQQVLSAELVVRDTTACVA